MPELFIGLGPTLDPIPQLTVRWKMLPRNRLARAGHLKLINPHHRLVLLARSPIPTRTASVFQTSNFHSSSRRLEELPKSPFQTFVDVLKEEIRKNREIQEGVKQLHGEVDAVRDSEAMRRAKEAYERARVRYDGYPDFPP